MAYVSIDLAAMAALVREIDGAITTVPAAGGSVRGCLATVHLECASTDRAGWDGPIVTWLNGATRDLHRRLTMARLIEQSTPGLSVVRFDDKYLSTMTDAQVNAAVTSVVNLLEKSDTRSTIDPQLLSLLGRNATDPYFAKALAQKLGPDELSRLLAKVQQGQHSAPTTQDQYEAWQHDYDDLTSSLGVTLGVASQGTGSLAVPGMAKAWADFISSHRPEMAAPSSAPPGGTTQGVGVVELSKLIAKGQWSDDFLVQTYRAVRSTEGSAGAAAWMSDTKYPSNDPLNNILGAMALNPGAVRTLFANGPRTSLTFDTDQACVTTTVNSELHSLLQRQGMTQDVLSTIVGTLQSAIASPPKVGSQAFQPMLANDIKSEIGWFAYQKKLQEQQQKEQDDKPWYEKVGHALLDIIGLIPVIGEPADLINGVWYFSEGDVVNGSLSLGAAIPYLGYVADAGKWTRRALKADELLELGKLEREGKVAQIFTRDGKLLTNADVADAATFETDRFFSAAELERWSGDRLFMRKIIAGNRFNAYANTKYTFTEISLGEKGTSALRVDAYVPNRFIVSRKFTQFSGISDKTAMSYLDEFVTKYPVGTVIRDTARNRELGIAGRRLRGQMILEVPPQAGPIPEDVLKYATSKRIIIRDINGKEYNSLTASAKVGSR